MKWLLFALIAVHGFIHFIGPVKAFGLAELPQVTQPISRAAGIVWLVAALAMLAAAALLIVAPRIWWSVGLVAVLVSQAVIVFSWTDARFGTVANALILVAVAYGFASEGPLGLRAEYRREVARRLATSDSYPLLTEADLAGLPDPVQRYLRVTGSVGQPRPGYLSARFRGRIRGTEQDPWMEFTAEQHGFLDEPARFFLMHARRGGLPVDVLHAFRDGAASMRVRLLSVVPLVNASGTDMTRSETVTLLNDLCLFAPGALIDPAIRWETVDARSARAHYTFRSNTVSAVLHFNDAGELVDFVSDDRLAVSPNGESFVQQRWSTPAGEYRSFGALRLMSRGVGRWHSAAGEFTYIELELVELEINGTRVES